MAQVIERYGMAVGPLMQEMALFFSCFGIPAGGDNRYTRLLDRSRGCAPILWSTLNYECLLEIAAARIGQSVSYFEEPTVTDTVAVWKLHGSVNFKVTGLQAGRGVRYGTGVVFGGGIEPIDLSRVRSEYRGNTSLYPAMALFAPDKPIAMSPAPITQAQNRWSGHVSDADHVIVLGVNPNPSDEHIWLPIASTAAEVFYVGGAEAFDTWTSEHRPHRPSRCLGSTWEEAEEEVLSIVEC